MVHNVYGSFGYNLIPWGWEFSPSPYNEASLGNDVEISRYWSLKTSELYGLDVDSSAEELNNVWPLDFLLTANENGLAMHENISSPPENSETVIGLVSFRVEICWVGDGGWSLGRRLYGTSHRGFCASLMCTLNRSSVSCLKLKLKQLLATNVIFKQLSYVIK